MHDNWSALLRFYVYGLHGLAIEILYTALYHVVVDGNIKLQGYSSVYAFFIYATATFAIELASPHMRNTPFYVRGLLYMLGAYAWEFSTGALLKQVNACPWNYEEYFHGHVYGVITLEYAPLWFGGTLLGEHFIQTYVLTGKVGLYMARHHRAKAEE